MASTVFTAVSRAARNAATATFVLALASGCAAVDESNGAGGARLQQTRDRYTACLAAEAEKDAANPAGAEDIAVAAHARCWAAWDAHRKIKYSTFAASARTPDERQLAHDKADAELRQLEIESRRNVVDRIVHRALTTKP